MHACVQESIQTYVQTYIVAFIDNFLHLFTSASACTNTCAFVESILIPVTVKKRDFHIGTPQKVHKANCFSWELAIGDLSGMICVYLFFTCPTFLLSLQLFLVLLVGCLVPFCVLQFVLFGGLPRAILRAPVGAFWWVASCHFACSSSCFLAGCLVPFCVLQFVLFGGLPRVTLRAPVCAFWWVASCHFACSSLCFLAGCLVPFCLLQFVLFGGLPRAILRAPVLFFGGLPHAILVQFACSNLREQLGRTIAQAAKNGALQGGLWLNFAISLVLIFVLCLVLTVTANRLETMHLHNFIFACFYAKICVGMQVDDYL